MNLNKLFLILLSATPLVWSCDDNDDAQPQISPEVQTAFSQKYPSADRISWETKGLYLIADFMNNSRSATAWFDNSGQWYMTETDLSMEQLPEAIRTSFYSGKYAKWQIDDIDMLERSDSITLYIIETEQGDTERDLYYSPDGLLLKDIPDNDSNDKYEDYLPETISDKIRTLIGEMYPDARIIDIDHEKEGTEVEIIHQNRSKDVLFNLSGEWIYTQYEVSQVEVPAPVSAALAAKFGNNVHIDDIDCYEEKSGKYYQFELEIDYKDTYITIQEDGTIRT